MHSTFTIFCVLYLVSCSTIHDIHVSLPSSSKSITYTGKNGENFFLSKFVFFSRIRKNEKFLRILEKKTSFEKNFHDFFLLFSQCIDCCESCTYYTGVTRTCRRLIFIYKNIFIWTARLKKNIINSSTLRATVVHLKHGGGRNFKNDRGSRF